MCESMTIVSLPATDGGKRHPASQRGGEQQEQRERLLRKTAEKNQPSCFSPLANFPFTTKHCVDAERPEEQKQKRRTAGNNDGKKKGSRRLDPHRTITTSRGQQEPQCRPELCGWGGSKVKRSQGLNAHQRGGINAIMEPSAKRHRNQIPSGVKL